MTVELRLDWELVFNELFLVVLRELVVLLLLLVVPLLSSDDPKRTIPPLILPFNPTVALPTVLFVFVLLFGTTMLEITCIGDFWVSAIDGANVAPDTRI